MITLEALRYMHNKTLWDVAKALQKDAQETLALLQGHRHFTLTPDEIMTLARCLEVPFEEAVAAANMSYAINHYRLLSPPLEETLEFRWHQEQQRSQRSYQQQRDQRSYQQQQQRGQYSYQQQAAPFAQPGIPSHIQHAFTLLDLQLDATIEQIRQAFRERVKRAADGKGGYSTDMDALVQAKELALAFQQAQQQR